jgi:hypothetical protein
MRLLATQGGKEALAVISVFGLVKLLCHGCFVFLLACCVRPGAILSCGSGGFSGCVLAVNEHEGFF